MSKAPKKTQFIQLAAGEPQPPIDHNVKIPPQVHHAAAVANALSEGKPAPPIRRRGKARSQIGFPYTDAQIDEALGLLERLDSPDFGIVRELAIEGAQHIKARRRGAEQPRGNSKDVTRRLEALTQAVMELSPKYKKHLTGSETIKRLRNAVIKRLGLPDNDDTVSEDTVRNDIRLVRPLLRWVVQQGKFPLHIKPKSQELPEKTLREMEAGRRALRRQASNKSG